MASRPLNANSRIVRAMKMREREVLEHIKCVGVYRPLLPSRTWRNAIARLVGDGKIRWSRGDGGGYVLMRRGK